MLGQQQNVDELARLNLGIESTIDMNGESHRIHQSTHDVEGWFTSTTLVRADDGRRDPHPMGDLDLGQSGATTQIFE